MTKSYGNRGMKLEKEFEKVCKVLSEYEDIHIYKIPTDWSVVRRGARIVNAFPKKKSIVDFLGAVGSKAIAIETKSTRNKTNFPLANIQPHQFLFFQQWNKRAKGYYIIRFEIWDETYLVDATVIQKLKDTMTRKSIPIAWFRSDSNSILLDELMDIKKHILK